MRDSISLPLLGICSRQEVRFTFAVHELDSLLAEAWSSAGGAVETFHVAIAWDARHGSRLCQQAEWLFMAGGEEFRNRPPVGCYCFLSLKVYYRDSCPFRLLVLLEQMTFVSSWIVALPRRDRSDQHACGTMTRISIENKKHQPGLYIYIYITTTNLSLQLLHGF